MTVTYVSLDDKLFYSLRVFTPMLAGGLSQEFESGKYNNETEFVQLCTYFIEFSQQMVVFTQIRVIASLLRSTGLSSIFWPISIMLKSGRSQFFLWFPIVPIHFLRLWGSFQAHQLQLVSSLPSCSTAFLSSLARSMYFKTVSCYMRLAAMLHQWDRPVEFWFRALNPSKRNYIHWEEEANVTMEAIREWIHEPKVKYFILITDQKVLSYFSINIKLRR